MRSFGPAEYFDEEVGGWLSRMQVYFSEVLAVEVFGGEHWHHFVC